eukprot:XP_001703296.1 ring-hydroxylating di-oxygenase-related protein [Chlamydomonas reinhardtii]
MNELPNDYSFWVEQGMDPAHANFLHHGLGAFRTNESVPMRGGMVRNQDIDVKSGWMWRHRGYEMKNEDMDAQRDFEPPFAIRATYDQPNGSRTQICTMQVPVRPGVCRTFFKMGVGKASKPTPGSAPPAPQSPPQVPAAASASAATSAAAEQATGDEYAGKKEREVKKETKRGGITDLLGKLPHWLFMSQLIADQDVVMMCRQEELMRREGLTRRDYWLNSRSDEGVAAINKWMKMAGYPNSLWDSNEPAAAGGSSTRSSAGTAAAAAASDPGSSTGAKHNHSRAEQLLSRGGAAAAQVAPLGQTYRGWPAAGVSLEQMLSRRERHLRHCVICQRGEVLVNRVCIALTAAAALVAAGTVVAALVGVMGGGGMAAVGGWRALGAAAAGAVALAVVAIKAWAFKEERFESGLPQWEQNGGYAMLRIKGSKVKGGKGQYKIEKPKK